MKKIYFAIIAAALLSLTTGCGAWLVDDSYTPAYSSGVYYTGDWWPSPNTWYPSYIPSTPPPPIVGNGPGSIIPGGGPWNRPVRPTRPPGPGGQMQPNTPTQPTPPTVSPSPGNAPQVPIQPLPGGNSNGQRPAASGRH